jgi:hypothetical protein
MQVRNILWESLHIAPSEMMGNIKHATVNTLSRRTDDKCLEECVHSNETSLGMPSNCVYLHLSNTSDRCGVADSAVRSRHTLCDIKLTSYQPNLVYKRIMNV